jgi:hypothetical protein
VRPNAAEYRWGSVEHASAIRAMVLLVWTVIVAGTPYQLYALFPPDSLRSASAFMQLLTASLGATILLSPFFLFCVQTSTIVACVSWLMFPSVGRWLGGPAVLGVFVLDALTKSIGGFANHAQTAALLLLALFAIFSRREYLSPVALLTGVRSPGDGAPSPLRPYSCGALVWLCAFVLVIPYTYIGLNRILIGGRELFSGDAIHDYLNTSASIINQAGWVTQDPWRDLLRWGFLGITCLEVSSIGTLFFPRYATFWLACIVLFHVTTLFTMNILFWENAVLLAVTFWPGWKHASTPLLLHGNDP